MKKFVLFLMVFSLLFCSVSFGEGEDGQPEEQTEAAEETAEETAGEEGPVTLTCYIAEVGEAPAENNKIYRMIEEQFGLKFRFEFLEGDMFERMNRIASGEEACPDLVSALPESRP